MFLRIQVQLKSRECAPHFRISVSVLSHVIQSKLTNRWGSQWAQKLPTWVWILPMPCGTES